MEKPFYTSYLIIPFIQADMVPLTYKYPCLESLKLLLDYGVDPSPVDSTMGKVSWIILNKTSEIFPIFSKHSSRLVRLQLNFIASKSSEAPQRMSVTATKIKRKLIRCMKYHQDTANRIG